MEAVRGTTKMPRYLDATTEGSEPTAGADAVDYIKSNLNDSIKLALEACLEKKPADAIKFIAEYLKDHNPLRTSETVTVELKELDDRPEIELGVSETQLPAVLQPMTMRYYSRSEARAAYSHPSPVPVITSFSPTAWDLQEIVQHLAEVIFDSKDKPPEGSDNQESAPGAKSGPVTVFIIQRNEVFYIDGRPFAGTLADRLRCAGCDSSMYAATEMVKEGLKTCKDVTVVSTVLESLENAAHQAGVVGMKFNIRIIEGWPNTLSIDALSKIDYVLKCIGDDDTEPLSPTVVLGFERETEAILPSFSLVPTVVGQTRSEYDTLSRLQRSIAEKRALQAMMEIEHTLSDTRMKNEIHKVEAEHFKLLRRRAARTEHRKVIFSEMLEAVDEETRPELMETISEMQQRRAERHENEDKRYRQTLHKARRVAATKIQATVRGHRVRKLHRSRRYSTSSEGMFDVPQALTSSSAVTDSGLFSPDANSPLDSGFTSPVFGLTLSALQSKGQALDGGFALLRTGVQRLVEINPDLFSTLRPLKYSPPKSIGVVKLKTRRVPPQFDGDTSSEEEDVSIDETANEKPQPLTKRHLQLNPLFVLQKCIAMANCDDEYHYPTTAPVAHAGVPAIQRRAYRKLEQLTWWTSIIGFLALRQRGLLDTNVLFSDWVQAEFRSLVGMFGRPHFYSRCIPRIADPHINSDGPVDGLTSPKESTFMCPSSSTRAMLLPSTPKLFEDETPITLPGTSITRVTESGLLFVAPHPLNLSEWKTTMTTLLNGEKASSVMWVHCGQHPTVYVGDRPYYGVAAADVLERDGQPLAMQMKNAVIEIIETPAPPERRGANNMSGFAPVPPSVVRRATRTSMQAADVVVEPHPPPDIPPRIANPSFSISASVTSVDWLQWELRLREQALESIVKADGVLNFLEYRVRRDTSVAQAMRQARSLVSGLEDVSFDERLVLESLRISKSRAMLKEVAMAAAAKGRRASRRDTQASSSSQHQLDVAASQDTRSNSGRHLNDPMRMASGRHLSRVRSSGRLSSRSRSPRNRSPHRTPPNEGSTTGGGDGGTTVASNASILGPDSPSPGKRLSLQSDPKALLPDTAKGVVKSYAQAATEVIDDMVKAGTLAGHQGPKGLYARAPIVIHSPSTAYTAMETAARITRDMFTRAMSSVYGTYPALVFCMTDVETMRREEILFVSTAATVHILLAKPIPKRFNRQDTMSTFFSRRSSGSSIASKPQSQVNWSGSAYAPAMSPLGSRRLGSIRQASEPQAAKAESEFVGLGSDEAEYSMEKIPTPTDESEIVATDDGDTAAGENEEGSVEEEEEPESVPGVTDLLDLLEGKGLIYQDMIINSILGGEGGRGELQSNASSAGADGDDEDEITGPMVVSAFIQRLVEICPIVGEIEASFKAIVAELADGDAVDPARAAHLGADAAMKWEQWILLHLFVVYFSSPSRCTFQEFVEEDGDVRDFLEDFDVLGRAMADAAPSIHARKLTTRRERWRTRKYPVQSVL